MARSGLARPGMARQGVVGQGKGANGARKGSGNSGAFFFWHSHARRLPGCPAWPAPGRRVRLEFFSRAPEGSQALWFRSDKFSKKT